VKMLQIQKADGTGLVKLSIVKGLGHGFFLTKPSLKAQKEGFKGPYQITHAGGCRLASASKPEVLEQVYLAVVANPTVQVALTEMAEVMGHALPRLDGAASRIEEMASKLKGVLNDRVVDAQHHFDVGCGRKAEGAALMGA